MVAVQYSLFIPEGFVWRPAGAGRGKVVRVLNDSSEVIDQSVNVLCIVLADTIDRGEPLPYPISEPVGDPSPLHLSGVVSKC